MTNANPAAKATREQNMIDEIGQAIANEDTESGSPGKTLIKEHGNFIEPQPGRQSVCSRPGMYEMLVQGGFMQIFKSAIPCSRSATLASAIMISLLVLPLIFVTKPSLGPQLSSSKMVPTLMSGSFAQENADRNPPVADGAIVFMEYTITIPESDLSIPNNLGLFEQGHHDLLPNVEKALTGMKKGEDKRIDLSSEEAFGPYDESKRGEISRDRLPADIQPGMIFMTDEGLPFIVVDLVGPMAKIDFNHPLAGRRVVFDVRILNVEVPSDSEQNVQPDDGDVADGPRTDFDFFSMQRRSHDI